MSNEVLRLSVKSDERINDMQSKIPLFFTHSDIFFSKQMGLHLNEKPRTFYVIKVMEHTNLI